MNTSDSCLARLLSNNLGGEGIKTGIYCSLEFFLTRFCLFGTGLKPTYAMLNKKSEPKKKRAEG